MEEIRLLGEEPASYFADIGLEGAIGADGYRVYIRAKMASMSRKNTGPRGVKAGFKSGMSSGWRLRRALMDLKAGKRVVFQCQGCRQIAARIAFYIKRSGGSLFTGKLCNACRANYHRNSGYMTWIKGDRSSPPPRLPRVSGPIIPSSQLNTRIVELLHWTLGDSGGSLISEDYQEFYATFELLRRSTGEWATRITDLCQNLGKPQQRPA